LRISMYYKNEGKVHFSEGENVNEMI